jgi:diguanylate cyclase (GGDEF)-like protein/PAS domain S-box-containing protein
MEFNLRLHEAIVFLLLFALLILLLMWLVRSRYLKRVEHIVDVTRRFGGGEGDARCQLAGKDELSVIAMALDSAFDQLLDCRNDLMEQQKRIELVIDSAGLGYWDWQLSSGTFHANKQYYRMLGISEQQDAVPAIQWESYVHPEDFEQTRITLRKHIENKTPFMLEFRLKHSSGEWLWIMGSGAVVSSDAVTGKPLRMCGTLQNINARKQAEQALRRSESRLQLSQRIAKMGSWHWHIDSGEHWWSDNMYTLFGIRSGIKPPDEIEVEAFVHPADHLLFAQKFKRIAKGELVEFEYAINDAQGEDHYLYCYAVPRLDDQGKVVSADGIVMDISDRKQAEARQRLAQAMFENAIEGMMVTDSKVRVVAVNRAYTTITGYSEEEVLGKDPSSIMPSPEHDEQFYKKMLQSLADNGQWQGEIWNIRKNGTQYPQWLSISAVKDDAGRVVNYVGSFSDISQVKESERRLNYLAHHDPLTDLPNRLLFTTRLEHSLEQAKRRGEELALLFVDLDNFKHINDSLGHTMGDEVLQVIGSRLKGAVRGNDTVARLGGDEFAVVLESAGNRDAVVEISDKLLKLIAAPVEIAGHKLALGGSIGISIFPGDGMVAGDLLKHADVAMYQAKQSGRNTFQFFDISMTSDMFERVLLESNLRRALDEGQLVLHYQPQFSLQSGAINGAEALIRWEHPQSGMISPARFIPLAEQSGLIVPIGEWVLRQACQQIVAWRQAGLMLERVAINCSAVQLIQPGVAQMVRKILSETACRGEWIDLELTEGCVMHGAEGVIELLSEFRDLGIRLAIDDFGTGYSSLSYLKRLPIDVLKIDKSFIDGIPGDDDDQAITRAIVALGKSMNLELVAEGVETSEQQQFLISLACESAQGYLFSRPVAADEFAQLLKK